MITNMMVRPSRYSITVAKRPPAKLERNLSIYPISVPSCSTAICNPLPVAAEGTTGAARHRRDRASPDCETLVSCKA